MGFASIVASAIGIILLIVTAYVLVSGVLVASETVVAAQKDMTAIQVKMLGTSLEITEATNASITVDNNGNEPIRDFEDMDIYIRLTEGGAWTLYRFSTDWSIIPSTQLDPGEEAIISLNTGLTSPSNVKIVTPNGVPACWP